MKFEMKSEKTVRVLSLQLSRLALPGAQGVNLGGSVHPLGLLSKLEDGIWTHDLKK